MTDEPYVTRREFEQFAAIAPLSVQLTEVIKDVTELRREVEHRFDEHNQRHEREEARRVNGRRWAVATVIAAVAAVDGPLVTILLARR